MQNLFKKIAHTERKRNKWLMLAWGGFLYWVLALQLFSVGILPLYLMVIAVSVTAGMVTTGFTLAYKEQSRLAYLYKKLNTLQEYR